MSSASLCSAAPLFQAVLTVIRTWIFSHTSSKIDVELGARLFRHLLSLPIAYFQARRVGDSVARVRELENIRSFLTGNAITLVMDVIFSFVFLGVMFLYSPALTLIVVISLPAYFLISRLLTPLLRARLKRKIQSRRLEPILSGGVDQRHRHAQVYGRGTALVRQLGKAACLYVSIGLSANNISNLAGSGITLVSKLVTVGIIWVGAPWS